MLWVRMLESAFNSTGGFMRSSRRSWWLVCLLGLPLVAQSPPIRPVSDAALQLVPDRFLREFDPITVFFKKAKGPENGGPVDTPGNLFRLSPSHPGTLEWLDANTLQFVPTIAWPALSRFRIEVGGQTFDLMTLVRAPSQIEPAPGTSDLVPRANIALTFPQHLDSETLAKMIRLEVKPLPGLDDQRGFWLSHTDFSLKSLERQRLEEPATYVLTTHNPLPDGHDVGLQIQVAPDSTLTEAVLTYHFQTRTPFRLTQAGIGQLAYPIAAQGSNYQREQVLNGGAAQQPLFLQFSHELRDPGIETIKKLVGFEPAVRNLTYEIHGKRILLYFDRDHDLGYRLTLRPATLLDVQNRMLDMPNQSQLWFFYPSLPHSLALDHKPGLVERYGPKQIPMSGLGDDQVDLRIYKIDPLDLRYWPFIGNNIGPIDEGQPPAGPGETPEDTANKAGHLRQLGSPLVSEVVNLPLNQATGMNRFGLNLTPYLDEISGPDTAATYLVGIRRLDENAHREYTRVQVTDLNLTSWEHRDGVTFAVTSLRTGKPVPQAEIKLEGRDRPNQEPVLLMQGTTDGDGLFHYHHREAMSVNLFRLTVRTTDDFLVMDPNQAPPFFFDNHWYRSSGPWLGWLRNNPNQIPENESIRVHLFSERPVYRPEDAVHIRGIIRRMDHGQPKLILDRQWQLDIFAPGGKTWKYPVTLDRWGTFYKKWVEKDLPSGEYIARLVDPQRPSQQFGSSLIFRKEPYRIPRFEVNLTGPDIARLDQPFTVSLLADYYAGGRVVGQEVIWRISQQNLTYRAPNWPGFLFSSDSRFSSSTTSGSFPVETKHDITGEDGSAKLEIDPSKHPERGPTRFVVEAEVRGLDQQSVSSVKTVQAMPPFVLGLKMDRLVKDTNLVQPQMLVLGPDGEPIAGQEFRLRLLRRQWHSYLRESDFTTGAVKYETDIVDEPVLEENHRSSEKPLIANFTIQEAGVYIVEMAARDHLGRLQKVHVDFFMVGDTAVSWEKSKDLVFDMAWDKTGYNPGETASLVLKSPFQEASALVAVESPEGLRYRWVNIENGQGVFQIAVTSAMARQVPVHAMLMRGRIDGTGPNTKPIAMASSKLLHVLPRGFQAELALDYESKQLPGAQMPIGLTLKDPDGNPLDGMVTLWLVDRAVLALGKEAQLDPVATFIRAHQSHMRLRDTRNLVFGEIPLEEMPGGDGAEELRIGLFGEVTVRRNFQTVPYYEPGIEVIGGKAQVTVPLPDNLTEFAIRAVAVAGGNRFCAAKGRVAIRLPVIVQSALPRFVRPGDRFEAGGIARVVEGEGGPAEAALKVEGLQAGGEVNRTITLDKEMPQRLFFPMTVQTQAAPLDQEPNHIKIALAVKRSADGASDAFEISLPVRPDRQRRYQETLQAAAPGETIPWPAPNQPAREGTLERQLRVTGQRSLVTMLAGLGFNARYPYGCTEQRVSQLYPETALRPILERLNLPNRLAESINPLRELLTYLKDAQDESGLFAFWPGSRGNVSLTAYVTQFLLTVPESEHDVTATMLERALTALKSAVRSDSPQLMRGYGLEERAAAILALVQAGREEEAYLNDLAALGRNLSLDGEASVLTALLKANPQPTPAANRMAEDLRRSLNISRTNNTAMLRDLQYRKESWGGPLLTSEARTIAGVTQALYQFDANAEEVDLLKSALVRLGSGDGWGDTRANAAALITLGDLLQRQAQDLASVRFQLKLAGRDLELNTEEYAVAQFETGDPTAGEISLVEAGPKAEPLVWMQTAYVPEESGNQVKPEQNGFAVSRDWKIYGEDGTGQPENHAVQAGETIGLPLGSVVEEHVRVVNPEDRTYVAVSVPFAAGLDPLNPQLATAPSYARPSGNMTLTPSFIKFSDDRIDYYYDQLPKGTYDFYIRLKATIAGTFTQPAAITEMMYRQSVYGVSAGSSIEITGSSD